MSTIQSSFLLSIRSAFSFLDKKRSPTWGLFQDRSHWNFVQTVNSPGFFHSVCKTNFLNQRKGCQFRAGVCNHQSKKACTYCQKGPPCWSFSSAMLWPHLSFYSTVFQDLEICKQGKPNHQLTHVSLSFPAKHTNVVFLPHIPFMVCTFQPELANCLILTNISIRALISASGDDDDSIFFCSLLHAWG